MGMTEAHWEEERNGGTLRKGAECDGGGTSGLKDHWEETEGSSGLDGGRWCLLRRAFRAEARKEVMVGWTLSTFLHEHDLRKCDAKRGDAVLLASLASIGAKSRAPESRSIHYAQ